MTNLASHTQQMLQDIRLTDESGFEFWSARALMIALGYKEWRKFEGVIERAKVASQNSGQREADHFVSSDKMVSLGSGSQRKIEDYLLTRYACYLIAQNGDSRKIEVSLAQTYFASQTRKQELREERDTEDKRLVARKKLKENEKKIEETVYTRGIHFPAEFATFKNKGIEALYNLSVKSLKERRGIPQKRALADYDTEVELRAKDFIYAMTDHNIKENRISGKSSLENELIANSKITRKALLERGIQPEILSPQEDLKQIEKRRAAEQNQLRAQKPKL